MKHIQRWLPIGFSICVLALLGAGWMVGQKVGVTPSEAQMGPGSQPPGPPLQGSPSKLPPKLLAAPTPPPEEEMGPPQDPTPRQRPTKESLLEKIRQGPGGKELLEEARKRGARLGTRKVESESTLSFLNPFRVEKAEASSSFSVTMDWSNSWHSSSSTYVRLYGVYLDAACYTYSRPYLYSVSSSSSFATNLGTQVTNPFAYLKVRIDTDGWYIVNFEASSSTSVNLKHYEGGVYSTAASWTNNGSGSYPTLLELSAGTHYFYWITSGSVFIYEANVYSL